LCQQLGVPFAHRLLPLSECLSSDEAMLAGTGFGLCGVSRIDATPLPWPGPLTARLMNAWNELTGLDLSAVPRGPSVEEGL
jgi:branched-subunit amino acid aminotransferase/4-amino-4-deoxychorismate lyase